MSNVRTQIGKVIGKSLNSYHSRVKPKIDELKFKEQYQGRIIDCMVGEVDDNYIETPETDEKVVKLEHSKDGVVKIARIKGKTILVDADGNETDTPAEGCRLVSVGEEEDNKLIILSKNEDNSLSHKTEILLNEPLRRINNDIYDEIVGNKIIRRVGKLYVDGTNNELYNLTVANHQNTDILQGFDIRLKNNLTISHPLICNNRNYNNREIWVHQNVGTIVVIRIPKEELSSLDIVGLKEWLIKNPITIFYKYVEPIIEELPNSITLQGFDDTTMYIENTITPTVSYGYNALIPYKQELLNQKEEVETNTLDIEQNIIPYLMDMEFNLMLMGDNE